MFSSSQKHIGLFGIAQAASEEYEMARLSRSDWPPKPDAVLNALRICRDAMTDVHSKVKINRPVYHAVSMVRAAINAMATLLTGDPQYFWAQGGVMPDQQRKAAAENASGERRDQKWDP